MIIGVLALQGAFARHQSVFNKLGIETVQIRRGEQLDQVHGLVIPGGESTTLLKLLNDFDLFKEIEKFKLQGGAFFGTCAGAILLGKTEDSNEQRFAYIDAYLERNAYGRQINSFNTSVSIDGFAEPFEAIFIRAPIIMKFGNQVKVLASDRNLPILAHSNRVLISTFHPELTDDLRIHQYFIEQVISG